MKIKSFVRLGSSVVRGLLLLGLGSVLVICVTTCGSEDGAEMNIPAPEPDAVEKLRNGVVTEGRPEVGRISNCTATLVAPDVAITAAHCVDFGTLSEPGNYNILRLVRNGELRRYTVNRFRSFSRTGPGEDDIALLGLATRVRSDFATPAPLARESPPIGHSLTVYGYGCTRIGGLGDGQKRRATFAQGERSQHLCPGDSGGPVFHDELGAIARINSGIYHDPGYTDIYGLVPGLYDQLTVQILEWSDGPIPDLDTPAPPDPEVKICGRDLQVFETWTCTAQRDHRYICPRGGTQTWEECANGCVPRPGADPDLCAGQPPPEPEDVTRPVVRVLSPQDGEEIAAGDRIEVEAIVTDDGELAGVHLLWAYNRQAYACPTLSPAVECAVEGDLHRWSVRVGTEGPRTFQVRARDAGGNELITNPRTVHVYTPEAPPDVEPEPPPEEPEPPPEGEEPPRPPPPNVPGAPEQPDELPPPGDNGVPTIEVLGPAHGSVHLTDSQIEVLARVTDGEGVSGAELAWAFNGNRYPCPTAGQYVTCVVDADIRRWTVSLGRAGPRTFHISARNTRNRVTTTPERTIDVRPSLDVTPPQVTILEPTPDTTWTANSTVEVNARIRDDGQVASAELLWEFNGLEYACPSSSQYVDCTVDGDRYTWLIRVSTGSRAFQIRATDDQANQTLSERRSLDLQE